MTEFELRVLRYLHMNADDFKKLNNRQMINDGFVPPLQLSTRTVYLHATKAHLNMIGQLSKMIGVGLRTYSWCDL